MELIQLAKKYFNLFSNKDIENLKKLYSNDIILTDWEIEVKGKKEVIKANQNIFNSVETINIIPKNIYQSDLVLICVIEIFVNKVETLKVIDILKFNKNKKIKEISAYKQ